MVPNAALRFRPAERRNAQAAPRSQDAAPASRGKRGDMARLWLWQDGQLQSVRIKVGISDGQRTVVSGETLREGMQVIVGSMQSATAGGGRC